MVAAERAGLPVLLCEDQAAWDAWLDEHGATARGVWPAHAKKASPVRTVSYVEAVEPLCATAGSTGRRPPATPTPSCSAAPLLIGDTSTELRRPNSEDGVGERLPVGHRHVDRAVAEHLQAHVRRPGVQVLAHPRGRRLEAARHHGVLRRSLPPRTASSSP